MILSSVAQLNTLNKDLLYYLASPYTAKGLVGHAKRKLQHSRATEITHIGAILIAEYGFLLLTPITASYSIVLHDPTSSLGGNWEQWKTLDEKQITQCDGGVIVAMMPGWKESTGVTAEIKHAHSLGKRVYFLEPALVLGELNALHRKQ